MAKTHTNISLSIDPKLYKRARARAAKIGFRNSFSAYVQMLINHDLENPELLTAQRGHSPQGPHLALR